MLSVLPYSRYTFHCDSFGSFIFSYRPNSSYICSSIQFVSNISQAVEVGPIFGGEQDAVATPASGLYLHSNHSSLAVVPGLRQSTMSFGAQQSASIVHFSSF